MSDMDTTTTAAAEPFDRTPPRDEIEAIRERRTALRLRHAQGLTALMTERDDLRGVHALADLVDDAVRWTA